MQWCAAYKAMLGVRWNKWVEEGGVWAAGRCRRPSRLLLTEHSWPCPQDNGLPSVTIRDAHGDRKPE